MSAQEHANASAAAAASFKSACEKEFLMHWRCSGRITRKPDRTRFLSDSVRIRFIDKTCASDLSLICIASSGFAATG